jgi:hypothetical protein
LRPKEFTHIALDETAEKFEAPKTLRPPMSDATCQPQKIGAEAALHRHGSGKSPSAQRAELELIDLGHPMSFRSTERSEGSGSKAKVQTRSALSLKFLLVTLAVGF